ncbi:MAG TPA: endo alpha-1,4 polygalactosaminidase [Pararobbsia sp.]|nr:endo alpha-1,4 polygalactosaminidase [Pararobbsia sp.]
MSGKRGTHAFGSSVARIIAAVMVCALAACGGGGGGSDDGTSGHTGAAGNPSTITTGTSPSSTPATLNSTTPTVTTRAFAAAPWMSFYGTVSSLGSTATIANTFRVMDVDLDPGAGNFSPSDVAALKANGSNIVLSYLNIGSCENFRTYWNTVPAGFVSCQANTAAHAGSYSGYPDEVWMNPSNPDYQHLIVDYVAPRLVAQGADGFYLDNLEIVEHGTSTSNGPCNAACAQGGLDIVRLLRAKYPSLVIVMQNATSDVTRLGQTGGVSFAGLLDGIAHEEVYQPNYDAQAEQELLNWESMNLTPNGHPFWIATLDYVGSCTATALAQAVYARSRAHGFVPYASDRSGGQNVVCNWGF